MEKPLRNGDIILTPGTRLIVRFLDATQPDDARYGHVSMVVDTDLIVESDLRVRKISFDKFFGMHKHYKIIRHRTLPDAFISAVCRLALGRVGDRYSFKRIGYQFLDNIFGTDWFTQRDTNPTHQVCSSLIAWCYSVGAGVGFNGSNWASTEPDDIDDESLNNPIAWKVVIEK